MKEEVYVYGADGAVPIKSHSSLYLKIKINA